MRLLSFSSEAPFVSWYDMNLIQMKLSFKSSIFTCCFQGSSNTLGSHDMSTMSGDIDSGSWPSMNLYRWTPKAADTLEGFEYVRSLETISLEMDHIVVTSMASSSISNADDDGFLHCPPPCPVGGPPLKAPPCVVAAPAAPEPPEAFQTALPSLQEMIVAQMVQMKLQDRLDKANNSESCNIVEPSEPSSKTEEKRTWKRRIHACFHKAKDALKCKWNRVKVRYSKPMTSPK